MSRSSQNTSETNSPYHSYRNLGDDWPWPTGSRLPDRIAIAQEICLHPNGTSAIMALRNALYDGEPNYTSNERKLLKEVTGPVNWPGYDTKFDENSQVDEIVLWSNDDSLVYRVSLGQRGENQGYVDDLVYPTDELKKRIARLDHGMHPSEHPDSEGDRLSDEEIEKYWEEKVRERKAERSIERRRNLPIDEPSRDGKSWENDWWAEDFVRHHLEHRSFIPPGGDQYLREMFADQLRIDVEVRRQESGEGRHLENKFSDRAKAKGSYRRIKEGFEGAAKKGHRRATAVDLTTYNKWHDSIEDEIANLNASISGVFDNLRRDDLLGSTPDRVGVIEFTDSGLPHAHVVFFGISPKQFPHDWLQDYWENTREQGKEIEVNEVGYSESRDQWLFSDGETPVSEYYTQTSKMMLDVAEGGDPRELTRQGGDHWKLAMHWASDEISQHERISDSLIGDDIKESTVLGITPRWISPGRDSFRDVRRDESGFDGKYGSIGYSEPLLNSGPWYQGLPPPCHSNVEI